VGPSGTSTMWYWSCVGNLGSSRRSSVDRTISTCVTPAALSLREEGTVRWSGAPLGHALHLSTAPRRPAIRGRGTALANPGARAAAKEQAVQARAQEGGDARFPVLGRAVWSEVQVGQDLPRVATK
jgi:hypothetical protein